VRRFRAWWQAFLDCHQVYAFLLAGFVQASGGRIIRVFAWLRKLLTPWSVQQLRTVSNHEAIVDKLRERLCEVAARPRTEKAQFALWDAVRLCLHAADALERAGDHENAAELRSLAYQWPRIIFPYAPIDPPPHAALAMPVPRPLKKLVVGSRSSVA
jgi:hypothetical protein